MSQQSHKQVKKIHAISHFYGCYLLRSIPKPNSFYIGSTPDPVRRLRQHNGDISAGAYKTKRKGYRPWEMVMIVHGFPNKIAALQFEHAWQHSYQTRHIDPLYKITKSKTSGRSIHHKLGNARLLINSQFFQKMNLKIQFFNSQIYNSWCTNKFNIRLTNELVRIDYNNTLPNDEVQNLGNVQAFKQNGIEQDKIFLGKFESVFSEKFNCDICGDELVKDDLLSVCYADEECDHIAHLRCISKKFETNTLDMNEVLLERIINDNIAPITKIPQSDIIPVKGKCPSCDKVMIWTTLVRYATLMRSKLQNGTTREEEEKEEEEDDKQRLEVDDST